MILEQIWNPTKREILSSDWSVPEAWQPIWKALRAATELSEADFEAFVQDCELEFGYRLPGSIEATPRHQKIVQKSLNQSKVSFL